MSDNYLFRNLDNIPMSLILSLKELMENHDKYTILEKQLKLTPIIMETDNYQISIQTIEELYELKKYLIKHYSRDHIPA